MNHSFTLDMANALAARLETEAKQTGARVTLAYQLAFARPPSKEEKSGALDLIGQHGLCAFTRALLNANELIYLN